MWLSKSDLQQFQLFVWKQNVSASCCSCYLQHVRAKAGDKCNFILFLLSWSHAVEHRISRCRLSYVNWCIAKTAAVLRSCDQTIPLCAAKFQRSHLSDSVTRHFHQHCHGNGSLVSKATRPASAGADSVHVPAAKLHSVCKRSQGSEPASVTIRQNADSALRGGGDVLPSIS